MRKLLQNKIIICLLSSVIFLLFTMPPRGILSVFTTSEVRPAAALNVVLGISFGLPAAIGITIGNTIADILTGYPWYVVLEGILPQFLYTYLPFLLWKKLTKGEDHIHRLDCFQRAIQYYLVVLVFAIVSGLLCAIQVKITFGANFLNCLFFVFLNNFTMATVLGYPLMVLSNQYMARLYGNDRKLSANEKTIIGASILEVLLITGIVTIVYSTNTHVGTLDIWNTIYVYAILAVNIFVALSLIVMKVGEKKRLQK